MVVDYVRVLDVKYCSREFSFMNQEPMNYFNMDGNPFLHNSVVLSNAKIFQEI